MKIGIISDTHGYAAVWEEVMEGIFRDADLILHAGDVLYQGPTNLMAEGHNSQKLIELINKTPCPIMIARGNCDADVDEMLLNPPLQSPCVHYRYGNVGVLVHHGHLWTKEQMFFKAEACKARICISGHTHIPKLYNIGPITFVNPGSCSLPKDRNCTRSVALIEENMLKLIDLDDGEVLADKDLGNIK